MITWGMVGNSHDASLAVFEDKKLLWAAMSKDFSGVLHDPDPDWTMLQVAIQSFGKPNKVVWYERPFLKTLRQWRAGQGWLYKDNDIRAYLKRWDISCKIEYTQHHLSHAAYAYYTQPFDDCAVICLDSIGEFETLTIWHGKNNKLRKIYSQGYPHSLGLFYSAMTQRMGFTPQRDEYLIAQHAKAGNAGRFMNVMLEEIIDIETRPIVKLKKNLHRGCLDWHPEIKTVQDIADLAATTQKVFEACVHVLSDYTKYETKSNNVALAGGGALNKRAIDGIRGDWENVWVPQNPGDPGSCIGAVLAKTKTTVNLDRIWYKK